MDPVAINLGPLEIRWYALAYLAGIIIAMMLMNREARKSETPFAVDDIARLTNNCVLGIIIGGRLGFVLFYNAEYYLSAPLEIFKVWNGGMSFHGGLLGVIAATILTVRKTKIPVFAISDLLACVSPIGLFFGRIANFINGELFGRITEHPIGMVFPNGGPLPRHPSQLYEASLEGLLLGVIMLMLWRRGWLHQHGRVTGVLLAGYGVARSMIEFVREPDAQIGLLLDSVSMGQLLSVPMIIFGAYLIMRRPASPERPPA
ncbi:MAG: prolipoprotein diacylglyceryl transferase [Candidatus Puniceispirillaceae bacterium]